MVNRLTQFIKNVEKYMSNKANNIDVFNCLFMSLEEAGNIKKKNPDTSGLEQSVVSKIMNGKMDIPKKYLQAAKNISPNDIVDSIEAEISCYINEDDQKRLAKVLASSIIKDDYYSLEEKNDITQCCIENDTPLLIATVFLLLLRKIETENDNNTQLSINCFYDGKVYSSLKVCDVRKPIDETINKKKQEIDFLYKKINEIHIEQQIAISNSILSKNEQLNQLATMFDSMKETTKIDEDVKQYVDKYASSFNISLSDDFYDLGNLKESKIRMPGCKVDRYGTNIEKDKYNSIINLYWNIMDLLYLMAYNNEFYFTHIIKIAVNNNSNIDDNDIVVKLLFPKGSVFKKYDYSFDNECSAKLFLALYKNYFEIKETIDYELYRVKPPINLPKAPIEPYTDPFFGNKTSEYVLEANDLFCDMDEYEYIDDDTYDVVKIEIGGIRKNSIILLSSPILLTKKINNIDYIIKSKNIVGDKTGSVKNK